MTCRHHLRHFVHSRTNVDTESFRTKPLRHQRIYRRVEENSDGPEDNNGCNSHGYFTGFRFHYWLSRQYRGSTTDTATGTDQPAGVLIQTKHFLPQKQASRKVLDSVSTSMMIPLIPTSAICENVRRKP